MTATFGRLTVIDAPPGRFWLCQCSCGSPIRSVCRFKLASGHSTSCGCKRAEAGAAFLRTSPPGKTHGGYRSAEYGVWQNMRHRCNNPRDKDFHRYGGRGIKVCARWESFALFLADMGQRPSPSLTLERDDNDGHYEPLNCRWATRSEQNRNQARWAKRDAAEVAA